MSVVRPLFSQPLHIIDRGKLKIGFDSRSKVAAWVMEVLTPSDLEKKVKRPRRFYPEKELPESLRVSDEDYRNSGYTRGHWAASSDFSGNESLRKATHCFSNIAPQLAEVNNVIMQAIELEVQGDVLKGRVTKVVSGPMFECEGPNDEIKRIGPSQVWVPTAFFKAWQVETVDQGTITRAYEVKHEVSAVAQRVTVAELEVRTGITFPFIEK